MIKSLLRYAKFFSYSLFSSASRNILFHDLNSACLGQRVKRNTTINPWSDKTYTEKERVLALDNAVSWLLNAQNAMHDDGFGSYHLTQKWTSSYVETSGYIIPTLLSYGLQKNDNVIINKCIAAADWLVKIQKPSGGWQGACVADDLPEVVFNTGQVIRGLISVYKYTGNAKYIDSAIKAADWLCEVQEKEGYWKKNAHINAERTYDSYVDAPLLMMFDITGKTIYKEKAVKNLEWIIEKKQLSNGWFEDCDNTIKRNEKPILHTIAYTIDGLLECGILLNDQGIINAAIKPADKLFDIFNKNKYLKSRFDKNWKGSEYLMPTGCAQIAIVWMKLFKQTKNIQYLNASLKMNDILIFIQDRKIKESESTKGALPGSFPIWGRYEPFCFPNWATKYFADALILENECLKEVQ